MKKSLVYFIRINDSDTAEARKAKLSMALDKSGLLGRIKKDYDVAIKMHFGERGNTGYIKPAFVRPVVDRLIEKNARPVLTDTNALYRGSRTGTAEHIGVAYEHGFTNAVTGAAVVIAEGDDGKDVTDIAIGGKYVKVAKIAALFSRVDSIIGIAHFKGHILTGFGGALKNIGMGCASREGKLDQHSDISPMVSIENCKGCSICEGACPSGAISIVGDKASIDNEKCIGCAECIAVCPDGAITVEWESGASFIQERMAEYAKAALRGKDEKSLFINFAVNIRQECDCFPQDFPRIAPDVGILISGDPVSVDKASMDIVIKACGKDVFKIAHPKRDGLKQLRHAGDIGVGNMNYELVEIK